MQAWCQKSSPFPQHGERAASLRPRQGRAAAAVTSAAFARVRKSVKLRRGKKVLRQDMTHYSWLHSASTASTLVASSSSSGVRMDLSKELRTF